MKHCWHYCGFVYTSNPPQHDEKCCQCGKVRRVGGLFEALDGHGPHVQVTVIRATYEDVGPCEEPSR